MKNFIYKHKVGLFIILIAIIYYEVISIAWVLLEILLYGKVYPSSIDSLVALFFAIVISKITWKSVLEKIKDVK